MKRIAIAVLVAVALGAAWVHADDYYDTEYWYPAPTHGSGIFTETIYPAYIRTQNEYTTLYADSTGNGEFIPYTVTYVVGICIYVSAPDSVPAFVQDTTQHRDGYETLYEIPTRHIENVWDADRKELLFFAKTDYMLESEFDQTIRPVIQDAIDNHYLLTFTINNGKLVRIERCAE